MTPIEQREIKGLTVKQAWIVVIGMITIVASVDLNGFTLTTP